MRTSLMIALVSSALLRWKVSCNYATSKSPTFTSSSNESLISLNSGSLGYVDKINTVKLVERGVAFQFVRCF